ncbi:MAG: SEL1-like repeat protein [Deltaproteobacteria bacterium]|nr:SEL1-like repeat protein [Deltaproteobacteria bacterium]
MLLKCFSRILLFFKNLVQFFTKTLAYADDHKIRTEYYKLAEQGDPDAQFSLALFYLTEDIEYKNWPEITKWLKSAADSGHREAQIKLGCLFKYGFGFSFNPELALTWFQTAFEQGCDEALIHLAAMENEGFYIPEDPKPLHDALFYAAITGNPLAQYNLALRLDKGSKEDQELAFNWYQMSLFGFRRLAENNDIFAKYHLGLIYLDGKGVPCDPKVSLDWFQKAGKNGLALAQFLAGMILLNGEGVPRNSTLGISWISKAANLGLIEAVLKMNELTTQGIGVVERLPKKPASSAKWFAEAKNKGPTELLEELCHMLLNDECRHCDINFQTRIFQHPDFKTPDPRSVRGADPFEIEGIEDPALIAKWFQKFAHQGDTYAQSVYGMFYYYGYGVPQDFASSAQWFKLAADSGDAYAQASLGMLLVKGQGVPNNFPKAFNFFQKASKQGNPEAQNNLALFLHHGYGGVKDPALSSKWFFNATDQNELPIAFGDLSCHELEPQTEDSFKNPNQNFDFFQQTADNEEAAGHHYKSFWQALETAVPKNPQKTVSYFQKTEKSWVMAKFYLGVAYLIGFGVPKDIAKGVGLIEKAGQLDSTENPRLRTFQGFLSWLDLSMVPFPPNFEEFLQKNAETDDDLIQFCLGFLYSKGIIVPQDLNKAEHYLLKAADFGNSSAIHYLGLMYLGKKGSSPNLSPASEKFLIAAKKRHTDAQFHLSLLLLDGVDIPQSPEYGLPWLEKAAFLGHKNAQYLLGKFLLEGVFVLKDPPLAAMWLLKAAEQGQMNAQSLLGIMFLEGEGVPYNLVKAIDWFEKAAQQGDLLAQKKLNKIFN